jgi:hypothetical protein
MDMNKTMSTEALIDLEAICARLGEPQDSKLVERVQERAREVRERLFREKGVLEVAVDLIRETREE